jgi:hypothetical protein
VGDRGLILFNCFNQQLINTDYDKQGMWILDNQWGNIIKRSDKEWTREEYQYRKNTHVEHKENNKLSI